MAKTDLKRTVAYIGLIAFWTLGASPSWSQGAPTSYSSDPEVLISPPVQPSPTETPEPTPYQAPAKQPRAPKNQDPALVDIKAVDAPVFMTKDDKSGLASVQRYGQGIIIDPQGVIVTSKHIIRDARHVYVMLSSGRKFEATVLRKSESDLCLIRINAPFPLNAVPLADPSKLQVGSNITAMTNAGFNPQRQRSGQIINVFKGTSSDMVELLEMNISLNPGDSGGPILDNQGSLLGLIMGKKISDPTKSFAVSSSRIEQEYSAYRASVLDEI